MFADSQPRRDSFHGSLRGSDAQVDVISKGVDILHFRIILRDLTRRHLVIRIQFKDASLESFHQFARRTLREYTSMVHKDDAVEAHGFIHIRRADQHRRTAAQKSDQQMPELLACNRVNAAGGFIEQKHLGTMDQARRQAQVFSASRLKAPRRDDR